MSTFKPIDSDAINALLTKDHVAKVGYPPREQHGPLRWADQEHRCLSRRCGSPTYCKVQGIWYCMKHALEKLNELLVAKGVEA